MTPEMALINHKFLIWQPSNSTAGSVNLWNTSGANDDRIVGFITPTSKGLYTAHVLPVGRDHYDLLSPTPLPAHDAMTLVWDAACLRLALEA